VLLPSDTYRNPITSITAVLPLFVTYLLTLPRILMAELVGYRPMSYVLRLIIWYQLNKSRSALWGWR
jgi:hypothetical protein